MNPLNRIDRLAYVLEKLSRGNAISAPLLAEHLNTTKKIVQTDFKSYLLPLFEEEKTIYYDYSSKAYHATPGFLNSTFLSAHEWAVIAILLNKARDKYADVDLLDKSKALFEKLKHALQNELYAFGPIERFDDFKEEVILITKAIKAKRGVHCLYNNKERLIHPLEILNLEGYWYLIVYEPRDEKVKTYHLNSVKSIEVLEESFGNAHADVVMRFKRAITAYFDPETEPIVVELYADATVAKYFERKPISITQRIMRKHEDGGCELELSIADFMEIIPTIQRYMPHVKVISPQALKDAIRKNVESYMGSE
jgi:predicted DNA-binding transcriptional regulator YafY